MKNKSKKTKKTVKKLSSKDIALLCASGAEEKKAVDVKILDVKKATPLTDYLVICTGDVEPHIRAICINIEEKLRENGKKSLKWEGKLNSSWMILDVGEVIVHVMGTIERKKYNLDELWEKSAIIYHL